MLVLVTITPFGRDNCDTIGPGDTRVIAGCGGHLQHSCPRPKLTFDTGFAASCFPHRAKLTPETGPETALYGRLYPAMAAYFRATNPITKLTSETHASVSRRFYPSKRTCTVAPEGNSTSAPSPSMCTVALP